MICLCVICGAAFKRKKNTTGKYCGRACAWAGSKGPEYNARIARESREKIRAAQPRLGAGNGYRKFYGRHEHRVVAERMLGRPLLPNEIVHHKDYDKRNNAPSNLEVMTQGEHMKRHGLGIKGMELPWEPWKSRRVAR